MAPTGGAGGEAGEDGGIAGSGGEGGSVEPSPLAVLSMSPSDGATGVEREPMIEVVFSVNVDAASVTSASFSLLGPAGQVSGTFDVVAGSVTFEPNEPLALLGVYTLKLSSAIQSVDGVSLGTVDDTSFQVRDGVFGEPVRLTSTPSYLSFPRGSAAGHVLAQWTDKLTPASSYVAQFDPKTATWGTAMPLEDDTTNSFSAVSASLNASGDAFAVTGGTTTALFKRATGGTWSGPTTIAQPRTSRLADDGSAMTFWEGIVGSERRVFAAEVSVADHWSPAVTLATAARTWAIEHFGAGYLAIFSHEPDYRVFYRVFDGTGWAVEKPLTPPATAANYVSLDTAGQVALFTWNAPGGRMQASLFDGTGWTTQDLGPVTGGTSGAVGAAKHAATWLNSLTAYVAVYDSKTGWGGPVKLGATTAEDVGPAIEVDQSGNALSAWPDDADITWRRLTAGGWSAPQQIKDQDAYSVRSTADASGNVMLVWDNPLGIWASRFE